MRLSRQFFFFMKRLIHANKTLKSAYTLKTQGYLYILCLLMLFFKDLSTNIKIKCPNNVYSLVLASKNKNI